MYLPFVEVPNLRRYSLLVLVVLVVAGWVLMPSLAVAAGCQDYLTQRDGGQ